MRLRKPCLPHVELLEDRCLLSPAAPASPAPCFSVDTTDVPALPDYYLTALGPSLYTAVYTYTYDASGRLSRATDPPGPATRPEQSRAQAAPLPPQEEGPLSASPGPSDAAASPLFAPETDERASFRSVADL
jgi:hypothetical protein